MPFEESTTPTGGVAVVIVTHAAPPSILEAAVGSVVERETGLDPAIPISVEVVDNGGQAPARLASHTDRIRLTLTANHGFAAAVNVGFVHGREREAGTLVCLNDDVVVTDGWLAPLVQTLTNNPRLGAVQPLMIDMGTGRINSAGVEIDRYGAGSDRLRDQVVEAAHGRAAYTLVDAVTGGAMAVSAPFFDSVGPLDERYFLYYEDLDWCRRGTAAGWRFAVVPESVVLHHGSATTDTLGSRMLYLQERNRLWHTARHGDAGQFVRAVGLSARRLRHRPYRVHGRALADGLLGAPRRWRERRARQ